MLTNTRSQDRQQLRYELDLNSWNLRIWGVAASGFLTDSYNLFASNVILTSITFVYFPDQRWPGLVINLFTLFGSWRFVMGVGIGAEYPLSAVITSEWSSTSSRATMISSVFMMQPVGQALAQLVGLWVVIGQNNRYDLQGMQCGINDKYEHECKQIIDGIWRIVIGSGCVPALLAIIFRFFLYDCGLYSLEVKAKPGTAFRDTQRVYGAPPPAVNVDSPYSPGGFQAQPFQFMPIQFSREDLYHYFITDGNWYYLLGTSATWFFLDVSFYGFSLDKGSTLADLWATSLKPAVTPDLSCWNSTLDGGNSTIPLWNEYGIPAWQTDYANPCSTIYDTLLDQAKQYLLTVSIASIAGTACYTFAANRLHRRHFLTASFLLLMVLFLITGGVIFPTSYRCTCHGISAAAGKIGSMVAVLVVYGINAGYKSSTRQGLIFLLFSLFMAMGAVCSWAYLPDIQRRVLDRETGKPLRLENKNLEDLGEGRERARRDGEVVTVGEKLRELRRRRRGAGFSLGSGSGGQEVRGQDIGMR
ncbi:hypothetical protein SLS63_001886 [Diaporthe eres]|uniref:Phosphate transporter n=1 Tax=Diaporthe eres TaxID=83184 RepID=A0ABR1PLW9_DIAER